MGRLRLRLSNTENTYLQVVAAYSKVLPYLVFSFVSDSMQINLSKTVLVSKPFAKLSHTFYLFLDENQ